MKPIAFYLLVCGTLLLLGLLFKTIGQGAVITIGLLLANIALFGWFSWVTKK